jgi:hypothetical protein
LRPLACSLSFGREHDGVSQPPAPAGSSRCR